MCHVDILGTHIVSAWYSLENRVRHGGGSIAAREQQRLEARWPAGTRWLMAQSGGAARNEEKVFGRGMTSGPDMS
jgi:hypothetical protein